MLYTRAEQSAARLDSVEPPILLPRRPPKREREYLGVFRWREWPRQVVRHPRLAQP